jgi:hypothetical protein
METLERYWYLAVLIVGAAGLLWLVVVRSRDAGSGAPRGVAGWFTFGPFWPTVDRYFSHRGGFTRREWVGWGVVLLVVVVAVVFVPGRS